MAVYAIISEKDNQTSLAYFKSKKIPQNNRVPVARLKQLVQVLSAGDVVHVVSVDRFPSVGVFVAFVDAVLKAGAIMKILEQSYLDVGNGKYYRQSIAEHLKVLAALESANGNRLLDSLKLTSTGKDYVARCVTDITVGILAKTYASDGILHRGN
ncbi:MAG: hypothetical protein K5895_10205 [Lachnospiraceae bacterium]|nr:hypothetical protein [Lachnospiraceae bacterium]